MRQLIGSGIEFPIGNFFVFEDDSYSIRRLVDPRFEQFMDALVASVVSFCVVPLNQ